MSKRDDITSHPDFYKVHKLRDPSKVLFLIIITLGFYAIWWFYLIARDFKDIDEEAPSANRALYIFLIFPCLVFLFFFVLQDIFKIINFYSSLMESWSWLIVLFLMLKFIFDFTQAYGKFTKTIGIYWFLGFFFGYVGVVFLIAGNLYVAPLILIFPVIIPSMQAQFNFWIDRLNIKKKSDVFYF